MGRIQRNHKRAFDDSALPAITLELWSLSLALAACLTLPLLPLLLMPLPSLSAAGEGLVIPRAVCLHEEDAGMLWKHTDTRLGHVEVRRNRRLVISMVSTFA